jgi:hypothetical protein
MVCAQLFVVLALGFRLRQIDDRSQVNGLFMGENSRLSRIAQRGSSLSGELGHFGSTGGGDVSVTTGKNRRVPVHEKR